MKRKLILLGVPLLVACEHLSLPDQAEDANVHISVTNISQQPMTRAAIADYATRLSFCIYDMQGSRLQQFNQMVGDDNFGTVNISLDNGQYKLVILAYSGDGYATMTDISKTTFKSNKVTDTFWTYTTFTVNGDVSLTERLSRVVAMVRLVTTAKPTANVSRMKFYYTGGSSTLDCMSGLGCVNSRQTVYYDVKSEANAQYDCYTFPHTEADVADTIKYQAQALDASDNIVHEMAVDDVPVRTGYVTTLTGQYFSKDGNVISITIDDASAQWQTINLNY